jgi:hypothetical protein
MDDGLNPEVICRQNPDASGIALRDDKKRHDITKKSGQYEPVLKDARPQHSSLRTQECDLRSDNHVQERSSDHNCGLKDASASFSVPKDASEPKMDVEGNTIGQKLQNTASRAIADQKIQRVSYIKLQLCNAGRNRRYRCVVNIDAIDRY